MLPSHVETVYNKNILQYIVSADGFIGLEYEHSPCEGVPVAVLHDYVLKYMLVIIAAYILLICRMYLIYMRIMIIIERIFIYL